MIRRIHTPESDFHIFTSGYSGVRRFRLDVTSDVLHSNNFEKIVSYHIGKFRGYELTVLIAQPKEGGRCGRDLTNKARIKIEQPKAEIIDKLHLYLNKALSR